jgi:mannose-6-phosphate isomerase-like protein (cupin superfamily)
MSEDTTQSAKYRAAHIDDMPNVPYEWAPDTEWKPVRRFFGVGSFGSNLFRVTKAGDVLTEEHTEDPESGTRHEELYLVVMGHATFTVGGEQVEAPAGTFVYVPDPSTKRGAVARDAGTTLLAIGGEPGCVFRPSEWDLEPLPE